MSGWTYQDLKGFLEYHDAAIGLLKQCGQPFKCVAHFRFCCSPGGAVWKGIDERSGHITLFEGCEPGAVAHEIGHGFEECLRKKDAGTEKFGEAYGETIRWFTEEKKGNKAWTDDFRDNKQNKDAEILDLCTFDWSKLLSNLKKQRLYP